MAYTRIHAIKTTLNKALDYIENPAKTQEQLLVSGYNVDPISASVEYRMTAALAREMKGDYAKTGGGRRLPVRHWISPGRREALIIRKFTRIIF